MTGCVFGRSAVKQGYLVDPYAEKLIRGRPSRQTYLRPPLINLGTHARTWAVDQLVESFLRDVVGEGEVGQIVSLGAGSDTRFWRLQVRPPFRPRLSWEKANSRFPSGARHRRTSCSSSG